VQQRSTTERGWRLAGLLVLFVIACFWMPLGARDAAGVSSVIPALGPSTLSRPGRPVAHPNAQPHSARPPAPVRARSLFLAGAAALLVAAVGAIVVLRVGDDVRSGLGPDTLRARGPPAVL
jgi:hypothetical protein